MLAAYHLLLPTREAYALAEEALVTAARLQEESATALYVGARLAPLSYL